VQSGVAPLRPASTVGLIWTLVRTDFKTRYHGTLGGFVWALLKPLLMFMVLLGVFSFLFVSDPRYRLNLIVGLFLWDFFNEGTKVGLLSLAAKNYLLTKVRFRSWIVVVTSISNAALTLLVFSLVIVAAITFAGRVPSALALGLYLWYLLHYALLVIGFSLGAAVLFLRYRDLNQMWEVVVQAGFFVAPIIYPLGIVPERFHFYFYLWPPTAIIQFTRAVLVEGTVPSLTAHLLLTLETLAALGAGIVIFRRFAPRAAEYV
jgi:lipopolysaccharide transport system permease protein